MKAPAALAARVSPPTTGSITPRAEPPTPLPRSRRDVPSCLSEPEALSTNSSYFSESTSPSTAATRRSWPAISAS